MSRRAMSSAGGRLDHVIELEVERSPLTGLAISLVRDGEPVWAKGYGVASAETGEAVTPDTCFALMSVTKTLVATALMQLRDRGCFELDDPVSKHLTPPVIRNEWENEAPVTVRQLLTHTGGLPVNTGVEPPGKHSLADYVRLVAKTERRPGTEIIYANWGFDVIGLLSSPDQRAMENTLDY